MIAVLVAVGYQRTSNRAKARATVERLRSVPAFTAHEVHVSPFNQAGIALDRERREVVLARGPSMMQMPVRAIARLEIIESTAPQGASRRSERGVARVVLRIDTDTPGHPPHDIVLLDAVGRTGGFARSDRRYGQARQTAEAWKARLMALGARAAG